MIADTITKPLLQEANQCHISSMNLAFRKLASNICSNCNIPIFPRNQLHIYIKALHNYIDEHFPSALLIDSDN